MDVRKSTTKVKKKKTTVNMIRCNLCSKIFKDRGALSKHQAVHSTDAPYQCPICDYTGKRQQYLRRHMKVKHTANKEFVCSVCGMTFHFGCKLKDHMRVHTGEKPYKCGECGKAFNASYSLNTHKLIHTGDKPYQCMFCAYACRDSSTLRKHQARHTGTEKYYQCKMCDVTCKNKSVLKLHIAEKHLDIDVRKFECSICAKRFKIKNNLSIHIQIVHDRSRTAKCDVCGLLLSSRGNLPAHMRTHVEEKPFLCTVELCERRFKDTSSLRKHTLYHFPEKHFACDICRKRFVKKANLERHLNTHRPKVKRVQCDYCGVRFLNKKYLTNHIVRKHSEVEKKYICDYCGFVTTNKPSLVMHIKYGHKRMFLTKCKLCKKRFLRPTYLKRHYWNVHGFDYKIPKRQKKKPKKSKIVIKEEPLDALVDEKIINMILKGEPTDDSAATNDNQLEDIPKEVFDELIDPHSKIPERTIRQTLDHRRKVTLKYPIDKNAEAQMKKSVKELLERTRQKKAALALERTRRKYNRLMRKALEKNSIKERRKIKYYNNNKQTSDAKTKQENDNTSTKKEKTELLIEHFSIDHETILNTDQDIINETNDDQARVQNNRESNDTRLSESNKNVLSKDTSTYKDTIANIDKDIIENTNRVIANTDQTTSENIDKTSFRKARDSIIFEDTLPNDDNALDDIDEQTDKADEISEADKVDSGTIEEKDEVKNETGGVIGRNKKVKFNTHQCYVCFKLFETKENLLEHCKTHFDVCNIKTWKKCPLCAYTTNLSVTKHLKLKHDIEINIPYGTFKDDNNDILKSKYYYDVGDKIINKVEIIPSVKNLNRLEYINMDKANKANKEKGVFKTKLVKKGKEWIVVKEKIKIKDCLLPKLDEVANLDAKGGYIEHMKALYRVAKKKGVKMMFPCDKCDKVCQTLSALTLHGRKHQANPKPFKPKVWKHKIDAKTKNNEAKAKASKKITNHAKIKTVINKQNLEIPKLDRRSRQAQNELYIEANRVSNPKPIVSKHRCKKELKEFYKNNIKGGDIEFWQFLKIYNKMGRENINDFPDLEKTRVFGYHTNVPNTTEVEGNENNGSKYVNSKNGRKLAFKKAKLSRKEFERRRNEIKKRLREKLRREELEVN